MAFFINYLLLLSMMMVVVCGEDGYATFGFDVHHRYSDPVTGIMDLDGLPEKGSYDYYAAISHRDRLIIGGRRQLAQTSDNSVPLTFLAGNVTYRLSSLGYLHYVNVSVGTPSKWFLVALDTGSDLFWLPCDCTSCTHHLTTRTGEPLDLNIYSPNTSSTSASVPCNNKFCQQNTGCFTSPDVCPYQVQYVSSNTSSSGLLVEDVLHLITDNSQLKSVEAPIKFGCGKMQTGSFLDGAAPNGLFGLGMDKISVPSILASRGLVANSFSMCFGPDGIGRIRFGDTGSSDQSETHLSIDQSNPTYNINVTEISVENNVTDLKLTAIFDSGTSFTYLTDPAYTFISENFDSLAQEKRISPGSGLPFEYCYRLSVNQDSFYVPNVNLTMNGGKQLYVNDPVVVFPNQAGGFVYCLGLIKSTEDINIIGQNFMTGYNIVFDREKMVLGWKASDCYDGKESTTLPINPSKSGPPPPPAATVEPEATSGNKDGSPSASPARPEPTLPGNYSPHSTSLGNILAIVVFFSLLAIT